MSKFLMEPLWFFIKSYHLLLNYYKKIKIFESWECKSILLSLISQTNLNNKIFYEFLYVI